MIRLLIKGHAFEAQNAASKRAISLHNIRVFRPGEITAETWEANQARVVQWYGDGGPAPFPAGTLLFFQTHRARHA